MQNKCPTRTSLRCWRNLIVPILGDMVTVGPDGRVVCDHVATVARIVGGDAVGRFLRDIPITVGGSHRNGGPDALRDPRDVAPIGRQCLAANHQH